MSLFLSQNSMYIMGLLNLVLIFCLVKFRLSEVRRNLILTMVVLLSTGLAYEASTGKKITTIPNAITAYFSEKAAEDSPNPVYYQNPANHL